jgi:hypothetical protein
VRQSHSDTLNVAGPPQAMQGRQRHLGSLCRNVAADVVIEGTSSCTVPDVTMAGPEALCETHFGNGEFSDQSTVVRELLEGQLAIVSGGLATLLAADIDIELCPRPWQPPVPHLLSPVQACGSSCRAPEHHPCVWCGTWFRAADPDRQAAPASESQGRMTRSSDSKQ